MARSEARIFTSIWRDPHFIGVDPVAQWLYMFILSQDDLTYCGVLPLRERRWASKAAGLTLHDIEGALKALEASPRRFVVADHDTGELLARSLVRRDGIWKQPNLLKQARDSAGQVESRLIRGAMLTELRRLPLAETGSDLVKTLVADFISDLEMGSPNPSPYPPDDPLPDGSEHGGDYPSDDASAKDHARARGLGDRYTPKPVIPDPLFPVAPNPLPTQGRKRGTRLPEDFAVTADMVKWAREHAPHVDGRRETERFMDHWRGKPGREGVKLDWLATWRNWMRNAEDRQGPRDRPARVPTTDQRMADAQALKATLGQPGRLEITT